MTHPGMLMVTDNYYKFVCMCVCVYVYAYVCVLGGGFWLHQCQFPGWSWEKQSLHSISGKAFANLHTQNTLLFTTAQANILLGLCFMVYILS